MSGECVCVRVQMKYHIVIFQNYPCTQHFFSHQHLPQRNTGRKVLVGGEWRQRRENNDFTLWKKKKVLLCEIFCSSGKKVIIEEWDGLGIEGGGGEAIEGITFLTVLWEKRNLIKQNTKSWRSLYEVCVTWLVLRLWLERQLPLGAVANVEIKSSAKIYWNIQVWWQIS